jgi:hypothetical protein
MPGVGKTKLILRFAHIVFAQFLYTHVFWMSGSTPDKLIEGLTKILDIVGHPERTRSEQNAKLTAARLWLEDSGQIDGVLWLLVLDNVDRSSLEFLSEHLPRRNVKGSILFTTRAADVAGALVSVSGRRHSTLELRVPDLVEITLFSRVQGSMRALFLPRRQEVYPDPWISFTRSRPGCVVYEANLHDTRQDARDIYAGVKNRGMSPEPRCNVTIDGDRKVIEWESDLATDQQRSAVATFDNLLDQLERDLPQTDDVLRILSFFDLEDIPLAMLTDGARKASSLLDQPLPRNSRHESSASTRSPHHSR